MGISSFSVRVSSPIEYRSETISNSSGTSTQTATVGSKSGSQGNYTFTITFTFKNVTLDANHNIYYFNLTPTDSSFPTYMIDEWIGTPVVYGQTTYNLNGYWVYSPFIAKPWAEASKSIPNNDWVIPSMNQYRTLSGASRTNYDDTSQQSISFNTVQKKCFGADTRYRSRDETAGGSGARRTIDIKNNGTTYSYGYPAEDYPHYYMYIKVKK